MGKNGENRYSIKKSKCTLAALEQEDCYHMDPDSQKIRLIFKYCLDEYTNCSIYKRLSKASKLRR
jgi:hypothetical protein